MVTVSDIARSFLAETPEEIAAVMVYKTCTIRMLPDQLAYIDAMAQSANVSRNIMANTLLEAAIGAVLGQTPDAIREEIEEARAELLGRAA